MTKAHHQNQLIDRFLSLKQSHRNGNRAPHKPLLVLLALARLQSGAPRLLHFKDIKGQLEELLLRFDRPQKSGKVQPELPFWHLTEPGIWEFAEPAQIEELRAKRANRKPTRRDLERVDAAAGFPRQVFEQLSQSPALRQQLAARLLEAHFPASLHELILDAIGFEWEAVPERVWSARLRRDPAFRLAVLDAYEHACAICGFDARLAGVPLAIEAAHIRWHSHDGPDEVDNGLALCPIHHRALDAGGIGLDPQNCVLVSPAISGTGEVKRTLRNIAGKELRAPTPGHSPPAIQHVEWHTQQVFRAELLCPRSG